MLFCKQFNSWLKSFYRNALIFLVPVLGASLNFFFLFSIPLCCTKSEKRSFTSADQLKNETRSAFFPLYWLYVSKTHDETRFLYTHSFHSCDHNLKHSTQLDRSLRKSDRFKVHY